VAHVVSLAFLVVIPEGDLLLLLLLPLPLLLLLPLLLRLPLPIFAVAVACLRRHPERSP
jgi:hypothetical protein